MQPEFTALQGPIHELKNLKKKFEETKILKLIKHIIKITYYKFNQNEIKIEFLKLLTRR